MTMSRYWVRSMGRMMTIMLTNEMYDGLQKVIDFLEECKDSYEHDGLVWIPKDEVNDAIDLLEELKDED